MRLGVHLPQFRRPVAGGEVAAVAQAAEAEGFDDVWVSDHLILPAGSRRPPEMFHDPLALLTWAGAATQRVGLGTSVLVVPYRGPIVLAKALASLDALSGGRVIAGVASGWHEAEFAALGVPYRERGTRTDEALAVCRALWSGEEDFAGRFTRFAGMRLAPGPARPGGPPLWIGGNSRAGLRRAARILAYDHRRSRRAGGGAGGAGRRAGRRRPRSGRAHDLRPGPRRRRPRRRAGAAPRRARRRPPARRSPGIGRGRPARIPAPGARGRLRPSAGVDSPRPRVRSCGPRGRSDEPFVAPSATGGA